MDARLKAAGRTTVAARHPPPSSMNTDSLPSRTTGWPGATRLRPAIAALAACLPLLSPAAGAGAAAEMPVQQLTAIEVVGSRIKRLDFESPLPVLSFSREDISRTGVTDLQQFIRKLPQNSLAYTNEAVFGFTPGAAAANLRGLGVEYTLTLVNGRRVSPFPIGAGATASFQNTQTVPLAAVERIEILTDGASAIYGTDAVAGVINYVLRKDFSGFEISTGYLNTVDKDLSTPTVTITGGLATSRGSALLFADFQKRNALYRRDRDWSRSSNHTDVGGLDLLTLGGQQPYGYPTYLRAVSATGAAFGPTYATQATPYNTQQLLQNLPGTAAWNAAITDPNTEASLSPETERYSLAGNFTYKLTDRTSSFTELGYTRVKTLNSVHPVALDSFGETVAGVGNLTVPAANPYNPLGVNRTDGGTPTDVRIWYRLRDFGQRVSNVTNNSVRLLTGLQGAFLEGWEWQGAAAYMSEEAVSHDTGHTYRPQLRNVLRGTTAATALNAFGSFSGGPTPTNQAALRQQASAARMLDAKYQTWLYDASATGNLAEIWGRRIGLAAGTEFRREKIQQVRDSATANGDITASGGGSNLFGQRDATSVFAELRVPLIKHVELQLAGRHEDYSDFGTAFKPKYAVAVRPVSWALLRGSYAEGFRAPALIQLFSAQNVSFQGAAVVDPHRRNPTNPAQVAAYTSLRTVSGGNPNLQPEESRSYYGGIVLEPTGGPLKNLSFSVDWSNTYVYDRIQVPSVSASMNQNDSAVVIRSPASPEDRALNQPGEVTELRLTFQNLAKRITEGLDFGVNYRLPTQSLGRFDFEWRGSWLYKFVTQSSSINAPVENRGTSGLPEWRWTGGTTWRFRDWKSAVTVNYVGRTDAFYQVQALAGTLPTRWVDLDRWLTWDVQVSRKLPWVRNTELLVGVDNLTNEDPPFYDQNAEGYDYRIANPFGAMYYLKLTKRF
jgi:outer membrane receptor protein involved in Fe transport